MGSSALVNSLNATFRLSEARYQAGIDSYLGVLVAQRSLYLAQQGLVSLHLARLGNQVNLYKVLGGGLVEGSPGRTVPLINDADSTSSKKVPDVD